MKLNTSMNFNASRLQLMEYGLRQFLWRSVKGGSWYEFPVSVYNHTNGDVTNSYLLEFENEQTQDFAARCTYTRYMNACRNILNRYVQNIFAIKSDNTEGKTEYGDYHYRKIPEQVKGNGISWKAVVSDLLLFGWVLLYYDTQNDTWACLNPLDVNVLCQDTINHTVDFELIDLRKPVQLGQGRHVNLEYKKQTPEQQKYIGVPGIVLSMSDDMTETDSTKSVIHDVAMLNWDHYQLSSWAKQYAYKHSFAFLAVQCDDPKSNEGDITIGNGFIVKYTGAKPEFITAQSALLAELREDIKHIEQQLLDISGLSNPAQFTEKQSGIGLFYLFSEQWGLLNWIIDKVEEREKRWREVEALYKGVNPAGIVIRYRHIISETMLQNYGTSVSKNNMEVNNGE